MATDIPSLPIVTRRDGSKPNLEILPKYLHVTDMPQGISKEEGLAFLAAKENPRNLPIKVFPEPPWWPEVLEQFGEH